MKKKRTRFIIIWIIVTLALLVGSFLAPSGSGEETVQVMMRDAVLHETNQISLFGIMTVTSGCPVSAYRMR